MSSLDPHRWQQVAALVDEAFEVPAEARAAWLEHACGGDEALRREVETLLRADEESAGFLAESADPHGELFAAAAEARGEAAAGEHAGRRLGSFRLVREIGRGGMGAVYLGERADGQFEQRVAVKLIAAGPDAARLLRDFRRERQILARLEHPNIARLIDGGMDVDGVPYLVMEYVEGEPITAWCAASRLGVRERLRIFLAVCAAVEAAHRAQVIHRDLKPSNILVSGAGEVKLLDFGVARELDLGGEATRTLLPALTPAYAAPEQLRGEATTVATDVYALGLLLYELLAGVRAQRPRREGADELLRVVLAEEPPPPSVAAAEGGGTYAGAAWRRALRGDLDRIVGKALEKEPERRYPSVAALAADLERHLAGEPITARGGALYRAAKLLRRRRLETAAIVLVGAAVAAALLLRRTPAVEPPLRFELLSTFAGSHRQPTLSPDGRRLAFVTEDGAGVPQIFVATLGGGAPRQLTREAAGARTPRWSNDGSIVYAVPGGGIWRVAGGGGPPTRLVERGFHPNLSRDGRSLLYELRTSIVVAHADGSEARPLPGVKLHFPFGGGDPAFSPDGKEVVYFQDTKDPVSGDLFGVPVTGGGPRRLTFDGVLAADPVWSPDGRWIYFSSARSGSLTLWRVPAAGGTPLPVTSGSGEDAEADVAADGGRLVYTNSRAVFALDWLDPASGARRTLLEERTTVTHPSFAPDGRRLAFFRGLAGGGRIATIGADGRGERPLTREGDYVLPDFSADGRSIYAYRLAPAPALVRLPATGGVPESVIARFPLYAHIGAHVDPSGRRAVYPNIVDGEFRSTVVRDLATGVERPLGERLAWPRWSPDGRAIAGSAVAGHLSLCPADGSPCRQLSARDGDPRWSGGWIYFASYTDALGEGDVKPIEIRRVRPDGSGEELVTVLPGAHPVHFFFDVSAGGQLAWCEYRPSRSELWTAALPRSTSAR
ncbi:MAG TPA: protein kinase [Thermoanaerobaculia bacterium]|jgi:Tol biopolymer transport system component|nr:protein kinase [Thermoanaerobaculia bacterium]